MRGVAGLAFCHFRFESGRLESLFVFPHYPFVPLVHGNSELEKAKFFAEKLAKPPVRESLPTLAGCEPYSSKVSRVADVLRYGNGSIQVDDSMPPPARHKHSLARVLNTLDHLWQSPIWIQVLQLLQPWKYEIKVMYGFIVFAFLHQVLASYESLEDF